LSKEALYFRKRPSSRALAAFLEARGPPRGRQLDDHFVSAPAKRKTPENRKDHFATRNETFRVPTGKSLKSWWVPNQ
jgi:hypothetical protein